MEYYFGPDDSNDANSEMDLQKASRILQRARFVVALTGAGISRASGLPLMNESLDGQRLERLFDPKFAKEDATSYFRLYARVLSDWRSVLPNDAHRALAAAGIWVVTLNVDGLHRDAGTEHLIEMHGNLRELRCDPCDAIFGSKLIKREIPPVCPNCLGPLRPGLSLQGEEIRHFSLAMDWVGRAEVLLVIGTSLNDSPANRFPDVALHNGTPVVRVDAQADRIVPKLLGKQKVHLG